MFAASEAVDVDVDVVVVWVLACWDLCEVSTTYHGMQGRP
jgi:hypothetical protein